MLGFQPPAIGDEEIAAVTETLRSGWLTSGPSAAKLEERMREFLEAEHVLAPKRGDHYHLGRGHDARILAQPPRDFVTVHARHAPIEQAHLISLIRPIRPIAKTPGV